MHTRRHQSAGQETINCTPELLEIERFAHKNQTAMLSIQIQPLFFSSKRAKEMLALLVHHRGGWVPIDKIIFLLLEDYAEEAAKSHIRMLLSRLKQSLSKYGIADIVENSYGKMRVLPEKFDCDYYRYLDGEKELPAGFLNFDGVSPVKRLNILLKYE